MIKEYIPCKTVVIHPNEWWRQKSLQGKKHYLKLTPKENRSLSLSVLVLKKFHNDTSKASQKSVLCNIQ